MLFRSAALEQRVDFFFALRRWEGEPVVREPARTGGLAWCLFAGLPEPVPPHERAVLELLWESLFGDRAVPAIMTFGFAPGEGIDLYRCAREH